MNIEELLQTLNFSSVTWQILAPIIFSIADIITGFAQAIINNNVQSSVMRQGLLHKTLIIVIIILSFVADLTFSLNFISKIVCGYVILMETMSILENLGRAGLDLKVLTKILKLDGRRKNKWQN